MPTGERGEQGSLERRGVAEGFGWVAGDRLARHELAVDGAEVGVGVVDPGRDAADRGEAVTAEPAAAEPPGGVAARLRGSTGRWLMIFGVSLGLFLVRFLVPVPVGQSDNRDGPRLMCAMGLGPVTDGHPRFFRYIYFEYIPSGICHGRPPYWSSELVPLAVARLLTPVFGLPGVLNLIALGIVFCVIASAGIASLAVGLRVRLWAQLLVAVGAWLIMADAAFFDVYASPFSEAAALVGLLLVAAGVVYLRRGGRAAALGLVLAGTGGFLAILSKEQYLILAVPVCLTLVLAGPGTGSERGWRRFRTWQGRASLAIAAVLAVLTLAYGAWDSLTHYGQRLQRVQAVDMIFTDIVTKQATQATAVADLRALGLPPVWANYAGDFYWHHHPQSVRVSPLFHRYESKLTHVNIAHYLLTHPASTVRIGQQSAIFAQQLRVTTLGNYPPDAGHPPGAAESRVLVLTWLAHQLPRGAGLWWLIPLWAAMAALAIAALRLPRGKAWHRDGAAAVLCMTGCAIVAFIPPAYFAGISTTRHMVGTNLATALALLISLTLAVSLIYHTLAREPETAATPAAPELAQLRR